MKQRIVFFDMDSCLIHSPTPETGRAEYLAKTGAEFPHVGWWSKPESLDMDVFDIRLIYKVDKIFQAASAESGTKTVLLTNRIGKMENACRKVLDHHNYKMDMYTFRAGSDNKGQRLRKILDTNFPTATEAEFYDDDPQHLRDAREAMRGHKVPVKLFMIDRGEIVPFN